MDIQVAVAFLFFALSMSLTPGGGNITLLSISNRHGFNAALPFVAGTSVGVLIIFMGVSAGLFGVLMTYPTVFMVFKLMGAGYLLYVAWTMAHFKFDETQTKTSASGFLAAIAIQVLNPKAWVAAMTAFSQFIDVSADYKEQVLNITVAFLIIMTLCTLTWAYFGVLMKQLLNSQRQMLIINRCLSATLVLTVISMLMH